MTIHTLTRQLFVPAPIAEVFAYFSRPENLSKIMPPDLGIVVLNPAPIEMRTGAQIDYTIGVFGLRLRWTTLITAFDPGRSFVDEQLRGPYALWRHSHRFAEAPGGTTVEDEVLYALPFGPLGALARALVVGPRLESIFDHRARAAGAVFGKGRP